jgi:peptide chain release factor 2
MSCYFRNGRVLRHLVGRGRFQSSGRGTMNQLIKNLNLRFEESLNEQRYRQMIKKKEDLQKIMSESNFWGENPNAIDISQEFNEVNTQYLSFHEIFEKFKETKELFELADSENDEALLKDCEVTLNRISIDLDQRKLDYIMLMDEGKSSCYVEIVAGTGGLDAFDWTKMLSSMYCKWGVSMGYRVSLIDENMEDYPGGDAGCRRVTLRIDGDKAYGHMAAEAGVHRLVRISPYDPKERRHTSFSQVLLNTLL